MPKPIKTQIETVTPAMCTKWLNKNINNRPLNQRHVNILTRTMIQDDWELNGESLKFDIYGNILDGQHRMWACIESNKDFKTMVVYNLPRGTFDTIDTGRVRGGHDVLAMNGEVNTVLLCGVLKHVGRYFSEQMLSTGKITNKELEELLELHPTVREIVTLLSRGAYRVKWCAPSIIGTCWYIASQKNKKQANDFFTGLIFGANLTEKSPILTLRNKFINAHNTKGSRFTSPEKMELIVIAWNAFRDGREVSQFKLPSLSKESKKFPKFK
jgi:hypothetical protein